ncbi:hypothetical protein ABMA32_05895 [Mesorhizobium sp. VNQ89]|uniref:hypothetical protein n=1 Tax=Mesorhizobium quangtriensis TaxID=3157709 RepID=UPI0032B855F5
MDIEDRRRIAAREKAIWIFFVVQLLGLTLFQKIGFPVAGSAVAISIPLMWGGIAVLAMQGYAKVDLTRLFLFCFFLFFAAIGLLSVQAFSVKAIGLVLAIYIPMVFTVRAREETVRRGMRLFVNIAVLIVPILALQWALQFTVRPGLWFNIETMIPRAFLVPDYYYERFVKYGSLLTKPNGIFFLEVSIVSQMIALAIVIELACFQDMRRVTVLLFGLVATTAGTGILLLALCAPLLIRYLHPKLLLMGIFAFIGLAILVAANGIPAIFDRTSEFSSQSESGYYRFVAPFFVLGSIFDQTSLLWRGEGPGNAPKELIVMLPFTKLIYEYGLLASIFFYAFLLVSFFKGSYNFTVSFAVFIFYNLLGAGLAVPVYGVAAIVLVTALRVDRNATGGQAILRSRPWRAAALQNF